MDLKRLLPNNHIVTKLSADNRRDILAALAAPLVSQDLITDLDQFLHDLDIRESQITTQLEKGIAIPHARSNAARRLCLTVGIANGNGLTYNPDASEPCRLFFLIAVPGFAPTSHLPLLQHLAKLANSEKHLQRLLATKTPAQAAKVITTFKPA